MQSLNPWLPRSWRQHLISSRSSHRCAARGRTRRIPEEVLHRALEAARRTLEARLPSELRAEIESSCIASGHEALRDGPASPPSFLDRDGILAELASTYLGALLRGDRNAASKLILEEARGGTQAKQFPRAPWLRTKCRDERRDSGDVSAVQPRPGARTPHRG